MASISSPGVGSGLDISSLVSQLIAAESEPASLRIEAGRIGAQTEVSALGALKSALEGFQNSLAKLGDPATYHGNAASSADTDIFTVSANSSAVAGSFDLEVVRLARAQKLASAGVADPGAAFGSGTLTIGMGADSFSVSIAAGADSLEEIRDAINAATDNPGVTATTIAVDDGLGGTHSKLVLTATKTGIENELTITALDDDGNDTDALGLSQLVYDPDGSGATNLSVLQAAVDSQVKLGTETITRSGNTISDAIAGVTINLVSASEPGETTTLEVSADTDAITSAVNAMISSYAGLRAVFAKLASYDAETGASGALLGDSMLRGVERGLRRELGGEVAGLGEGLSSLAAIGITTKANGALEIDSTRFGEVLAANPDALETLFASAGTGLADRLDAVLEPFTQASGAIDLRVDGLNTRLRRLDDQSAALDRRIESLESRLLAQFSAMDSLVGSLQSTSTFLTQQFDAIRNLAGSRSNR